MPYTWYEQPIIRIEQASPTVKLFWIQRPEGFSYKAGQFITLDLPISERRRQRWRSYSIANAPSEAEANDHIELCIVRLDGGAGTTYLFEEAEVGTQLRFKGPDGAFVLRDTADKEIVMIATGTGVAPFRAMIQEWHLQQQPAFKSIHLLFGTRYVSGLLYRDEFELLEQTSNIFKYSVALSREQEKTTKALAFESVTAYVHALYKKHYSKTDAKRQFYICGWSQMIDQAVETLIIELGYDKSQILYELYG